MGYCLWPIWRSCVGLRCPVISYLRTSGQVFNYKVGTRFTWITEKHKRLQGDVRCQFICDLYYPSLFLCHNSLVCRDLAVMKARKTSYASLTHKWRVAGYQMKEGIDGRQAEGHVRAAGRLADLWPETSHVCQNFLLDWIKLDMLCTPFCETHKHTDAWLTNMTFYCVCIKVGWVDTWDLNRLETLCF